MTKRKKIGRPKVPRSKARNPGISIRLSNDELQRIKTAAGKCDESLSNWSRKILLSAAP
jgi:hypothetical protein